MKKNYFLVSFLYCSMSMVLYGQHRVKGMVTDTDGTPIAGANVLEKGTVNGVITDFDGNYSIDVSGGKLNLVFSFIGFKNEEYYIDGSTTLDVVLEEDFSSLDEVIIVGYGSQKRESVVGAISQVSGEELTKANVIDATNTLTGRAPGVRVVQLSSEPGSYDSEIDIRGFGSPLYVIDGIQSDKATFSRLNPQDIESVSVLKDASAAIYGVQSANGVILVKTRRGSLGKPTFNYSTNYGINLVTQYPELSDAYHYSLLYTEWQVNNEISNGRVDQLDTFGFRFSPEDLEDYRTGERPSTDFLNLILKKQTNTIQHNFTVNGGVEKMKYYASFGYLEEDGIWSSDALKSKKYNARLNVDTDLSDDFKFNVTTSYIIDKTRRPNTGNLGILKFAWRQTPTEQAYANGNPDFINSLERGWDNPLASINSDLSGSFGQEQTRLNTNFELVYSAPFLSGLTAKANYSYNTHLQKNETFNRNWNEFTYDQATNEYDPILRGGQAYYQEFWGKTLFQNSRFTLDYGAEVGSHKLKLLAIAESQKEFYESIQGRSDLTVSLPNFNSGDVKTESVEGQQGRERNRIAYAGRFNYEFDDRYFAEFSFRYDGSSRFPNNGRWGFFPGVSLGWIISQEQLIKDKLSFIDFLKVRGSYGELGDDSGVNDFAYLTGYTYPEGGYFFDDGYYQGLGIRSSANQNLTWFTSRTINFGVEAKFFDGLFSAEFDYFKRKRDGLLLFRNATLPSTFGVTLPQENLGDDQTKGWELVLGHRKRIGEFAYSINGNVTFTRSTLGNREENPAGNSWDYYRNHRQGRYYNTIFGYQSEGQFQSFEEIYEHAVLDGNGNKTLLPGDIKYKDLNNDGLINEQDQTIIALGNGKPSTFFAVDFGLDYRNWDMSILFQGTTNHHEYYKEQLSRPFFFGDANPITEFQDRWYRTDPYDAGSEWVSGKYPAMGERQNYVESDFWWRSISYLRLKNAEIGYTITKDKVSHLGLQKVRLYANGFNIFTITNGLDFIDPESRGDRNYAYNYPITLNLSLGVQIQF